MVDEGNTVEATGLGHLGTFNDVVDPEPYLG